MCENGTKVAKWWAKGTLCTSGSRHPKRLETEPDLLSRVVAGGKSWIFEYDPLTKQQSLNGRVRRHQDPRKGVQSKIKVMLIVFF